MPVTYCIGLATIASETEKDPVLNMLRDYIRDGKQCIPTPDAPDLQKCTMRHPDDIKL